MLEAFAGVRLCHQAARQGHSKRKASAGAGFD